MSGFILSAAGLLALALLFVLPPLLRRRDRAGIIGVDAAALNIDVLRAQHRELDADLHSGALSEQAYVAAQRDLLSHSTNEASIETAALPAAAPQPWTAAMVAVAITVIAAVLYQVAGTPEALDPARRLAQIPSSSAAAPETAVAAAAPDGGGMTADQIEGMVQRLATKLAAKPDDPDGWRMLIRSYETLRRFDQAAAAYANLLKYTPETPELLADYAVVLGMTQGQTLTGEPERLIHRALKLDPDNLQALALAGSAAFERHDYAKAVGPWQNLLALVPQDSEMARTIGASIDKARALQDASPGPDAKKESP